MEAIYDHVHNMLKQGTIEPASSPWASNVVLVKKRMVLLDVSYIIGSLIRSPVYRLPGIDDCLHAKLFSTFDLRSFYHQVEVAPQYIVGYRYIPRGQINVVLSIQDYIYLSPRNVPISHYAIYSL